MRKPAILLAFALLCFTAGAKQINENQAAAIAGKYLNTATRSLKALRTSDGAQNNSEYYIFNSGSDKGFVIISGDDELTELVGYSDKGEFSTVDMPENISNWLDDYATYVRRFREGKAEAKNIKYASATPVVSPLITTRWNQKEPYNLLCPGDKRHGLCPTGCAATAFAQVMNYWEWPKVGKGVHSYRNDFRTETVDFSQSVYQWDKMLDEYLYGKNQSGFIVEQWTEEEGNAVAKLMYDCGVAINMEYAFNASGSTDSEIKDAAVKYFKYDTQLYPRNSFTSPQFMQIIKTELINKRPVLFGGQGASGGHEFVIDGYDSNDYLHVNWGWGGLSDGYFNIDYMNPSNLGTGGGSGGFSYDQSIVLLQPNSTGTPTANDEYLAILPEGYLDGFKGYLKALDQKVKKGEPMRFVVNGIWNYSQKTYMGDAGFAVFNKDGERLTIPTKTERLNLESGYLTDTESTIALGAELQPLADGVYYVYPVSKQMDLKKETEWLRVSCPDNFMIQISGDEVAIVNEDLTLEVKGPITASTDRFELGRFVFFTATLHNPTSQLAEGYVQLEILDEETQETYFSETKDILLYDQASISFSTQVRLLGAYEAGKSYRVTLSPVFNSFNDKKFKVNVKPENDLVFTIIDPAGVEDVTTENAVSIYPNPTADFVNIQTVANLISAQLFTADGRLVKEASNAQMDLTDCPSGYYLIKVVTEDGSFNRQIIKK